MFLQKRRKPQGCTLGKLWNDKSHYTKLAVVWNNSIVIAELGYPLCRSTFRMLARFIHPREKSRYRYREHTRRSFGEKRRKIQCEPQLHARCTDGSRLRQVKTGLLGKLYQVRSCYPRRDFAWELLLNTSLLSRSHPHSTEPKSSV